MRRLFLFLILVSLPALLLAKKAGQGGGSDPEEGYFVRVSPPQPGEFLTRTVAGDLDGDRQQDVAYLLGNRIEVMIDPGLYEALMTDVATGADMVTIPSDERDDLLVVDWLGIKRVSWDVHDVDENSLWITTRRQDPSWLGVDVLRTWTGVGGEPYVFGLRGDDKSITWMVPGAGDWVTQPIFHTESEDDFLDIAPLDFDADGEPELAAIFETGIVVYEMGDPDHVARHSIGGITSIALTRIRHPDGNPQTADREYAGWVVETANGVQHFAVVSETGVSNPVAMGPAQMVTFRAGDVDADGDDDLLCASKANWDLTWVTNSGTTEPEFLPSSSVARGPQVSVPATQNVGWPVIADLDGDGDGDVAYPVQDTEPFLWIRKEEAIAQAEMRPRLVTQDVNGLSVGARVDDQQNLKFDVEVDPAMPGEFLKVVAWTQPDPDSYMNPIPILYSRQDVSGRVVTVSSGCQTAVPGGPSQYVPPEETTATFEPLVYVLLQMYDAAALEAPPTKVWPGLLVVLHAQGMEDPSTGGPTPNEEFVAGLEAPFEFAVLTEDPGPPGPENPGGPPDGPGGEEAGRGGDVPCTPVPNNNAPTGR